MKIVKIDHVTLMTADIEACIRFYKVLGFRTEDAKGRYELSAGDFRIHVYRKNEPGYIQPTKAQPGAVEICLELDGGIDMLRSYLVSQGMEIADEITPKSGARGVMRTFFLRDPDGNLVEIASYND